jgi:nuclear pore complex protein Nup205
MTTPKKTQAQTRSSQTKAKGKRKLDDNQATSSTRPSKQSRSIADLLTSSQRGEEEDTPSTPNKSSGRVRRGKATESPESVTSTQSFANMYNFPSTKAKTNGVVDLTGSSPTSSPQSALRKKSLNTSSRPLAFNPHQGPRKLVVKNLRTTPRVDPQEYFEKVWGQETTSLTAIFHDDKVQHSLEELYKGSENVCRQGKAAELYTRLRQKCEDHLAGKVTEDLKTVAAKSSNVETLEAVVLAWAKWQRQLLTVRQIFYYLDQAYLLRSNDLSSITETGITLFRDHVFENDALKPKIVDGIVDLIAMDRMRNICQPNSSLLRQSIDTLHELGVYTSSFEPVFVRASEAYYRTWRGGEAEQADLAHYINETADLIEQEMTRCDLLTFDRTTRSQLSELIDDVLVGEKVDYLTTEDDVLDLLEADRFVELERLFTLLERVSEGEKLGPIFDKFIIAEGSAIVFDEKREAEMVLNLLDFKARLDKYLRTSFHHNKNMDNGMHKSFEHFINKTKKTQANWDTDNAKPGEMIAKHVDLLLKGGVKAIPRLASTGKPGGPKAEEEHDFDDPQADEDAEINMHLSNALDLFRFVHGKAVFEAFYKKDLARRLLMGRSASNDAERNMLTRLKNECGAGFTHNLESMFKDMDLAREEMLSYTTRMDERGSRGDGPDLAVNVLSASAWPTYPDVAVNLPPAISRVMSRFDEHYKSKHSGRKLTFKNALAHCQLKAKFPKGSKEIVVSGFQAVVLLMFNDVPTPTTAITYAEIKSATALSDAELKRTLQSLACAKYRVLSKDPKGREVNETDKFTFNASFSDPKMRIKINQIQLKETKQENKETHQRVAADRHYETQAAIVRIMKSRKTIGHNDLIIEVIKATRSRGVLDQADIKKNIEKYVHCPECV